MAQTTKCILCDSNAQISVLNNQYRYRYTCPNCGTYIVSDNVKDDGIDKDLPKHILSGYARELSDSGKEAYFSTNSLKNIIDSPLIPQSPFEKLDKLLIWYYRQSDYFGKAVKISDTPAICYAVNKLELEKLHNQILDMYLKQNNVNQVFLTLEGYQHCAKVLSSKSRTTNAFVAMWFDPDVSDIYNAAIAPAIEECGFRPVRVDNVEHNNDITDEIIAGIKDSRFVIADMTGYRGGVYYEAGYARGLGIPVIFTCRKDWFDGEKDADGKTVKEKIHFDINHQNIIVWETEDDLKKRIIDRIRATIL